MDESIWRLPGPDRLIDKVIQEVQRGRHVAVVLPAFRAGDETFVEGLTAALMRGLSAAGEDPCRAATRQPGHSLERWLAECLVFDDVMPATVVELLDHPDAAGRTSVVDGTELEPADQERFSALLARLARESRPRPATRRPRVVAIGTRHLLPGSGIGGAGNPGLGDDVTFEAVWWWGRMTRWDVAARISPAVDCGPDDGVLREVRLETLVEICRWDLDLAECLARLWDGNPGGLATAIKHTARQPPAYDGPPARNGHMSETRPHDGVMDLWDAGRIEWWHHEHSRGPYDLLAERGAIERAVWVAQTRILLPWIEVHRRLLLGLLFKRFGRSAVTRALNGVNVSDHDLIEVGPLFVVARELTPRSHAIREAAYHLWVTRNKLAHLDGLSVVAQRQLVDACAAAVRSA